MAIDVQTASASSETDVREKVEQLRELFADASEVGKKACD